MDSGKKKFDPRSIDEKAILDIVARKGTIRPDSPATSVSPKPEDTAEEIAGSSEAPVFTTGEIDAYRASFLNTVRTKSRKSLHIDADLHRRISSLVWAGGTWRGDRSRFCKPGAGTSFRRERRIDKRCAGEVLPITKIIRTWNTFLLSCSSMPLT